VDSALARLSLRFAIFLIYLLKYTARIYLEQKLFISVIVVLVKGKSRYIFPSLPTAFASLLIPYPAPTVDKPYCLSHLSFIIENASQRRSAKAGVMWLKGWPVLQLPFR
jgi:hypothetical protein